MLLAFFARFYSLADAATCPLRTLHGVLARAGVFVSDRAGSVAFSLVEGAIGGDASVLVAAMICC